MSRRVAVVGAGMAGLACARAVAEQGIQVCVFDKARGPGGRMASRRTDQAQFDHGAVAFRAQHPDFVSAVTQWQERDLVQQWAPRQVVLAAPGTFREQDPPRRWLGVPRMSALTRALSADVDLVASQRVQRVERRGDSWQLWTGAEAAQVEAYADRFDSVLVAVPAPQATPLLEAAPALAQRSAEAVVAPAWALMIRLHQEPDFGWDEALVEDGVLERVICNHRKPDRAATPCLVVHAHPAWSAVHLEEQPDQIRQQLLSHVQSLLGLGDEDLAEVLVHRWRYAHVREPLAMDCLWDGSLQIGACGDWCLQGNVEGAYRSGLALAARVLGQAGG